MRWAIMALVALATLIGGGWASASFTLTARVAEVTQGAPALCRPSRSGQLPTMEQLAKQLVDLAAEQELMAGEVRVITEPLGAGKDQGSLGAVQGQLSKLTRGKLKAEGTFVRMQARLTGKRWLWTVDQAMEATCSVQGKLTRVGP